MCDARCGTAGGAEALWQRRSAGAGAAVSGAGAWSAKGDAAVGRKRAPRSPSKGCPGKRACRHALGGKALHGQVTLTVDSSALCVVAMSMTRLLQCGDSCRVCAVCYCYS